MPRYEIRDADTYGHAIGILLLDYRGPFIPGDVGNATTYGYPVLYKLVEGLTLDRVLAGDPTARIRSSRQRGSSNGSACAASRRTADS